MQKQVPHGLLSATATTIAASFQQEAGCRSSASHDEEKSGATNAVEDHGKVQTRTAVAHEQKGTTALVSNAHAQGMAGTATARWEKTEATAHKRCMRANASFNGHGG